MPCRGARNGGYSRRSRRRDVDNTRRAAMATARGDRWRRKDAPHPPSSETPHPLRHGRVALCNRTLLSAPCLRASVPMPIMPQRRHCRIRGASRARLVRNEPHERLDDHKQ